MLMKSHAFLILFFALTTSSVLAYNIDLKGITVSGLSSGAYMAGQVHVALSDIFSGVGLVAGGPYYCAANNLNKALTECMSAESGAPSYKDSVSEYLSAEKQKQVGSRESLRLARVYLFSGTQDEVVSSKVVETAVDFYRALGVESDRITFISNLRAGHSFPTLNFGNRCGEKRKSPFISQCSYDTAKEIFESLYNEKLKSPVQSVEKNYFLFKQAPYVNKKTYENSIGEMAYAYVPTVCQNGQKCRLHFVFHGCKQTLADIGDVFVKYAGYNRWAESNQIIVIYPQAERSVLVGNPNGCWDWWGYTGKNYHLRGAPQIEMVRKMVQAIARPTTYFK